jgi:hypothetical protein
MVGDAGSAALDTGGFYAMLLRPAHGAIALGLKDLKRTHS